MSTQLDLADRFGKMRGGYRQNTFGFRLYLMHSEPLRRVLYKVGVQHANYFRRKAPRGHEAGQGRSADTVRVMAAVIGGRKMDRATVTVKAKIRNRAGYDAMKGSLVHVSKGKKISRGGRVS